MPIRYIKHFTISMCFLLNCSSGDDQDSGANNATNTTQHTTTSKEKPTFDQERYDALLQKYVHAQGLVDYASLKADDELSLRTLAAEVGKTNTSTLSEKAKLAFYINAYNILVLNSVIKLFPIPSVNDVNGFFDQQEIKVGGELMTLNELENNIIRTDFAEPRIHFALVCAAKSCPPLLNKSYREATLEEVLENNTKAFIEKTSSVAGKTITVSSLFDWYQKDFKSDENTVEKFLAKYLPDHKALLDSGDAIIEFSEYDWALNEQK